jgi:hypothetical protein
MLVRESISFERGKDPKETLGIGEKRYFYIHSMREEMNNLMKKYNGKNYYENVDEFHRASFVECEINKLIYYIQYNKKSELLFRSNNEKSIPLFGSGYFGYKYGKYLTIHKSYYTLKESVDNLEKMIIKNEVS